MEVIAVSHSLPQWHIINGARTFTSIVHEPLTRPQDYIELHESGIIDNKTAVHDGPVYAFFAEHYDYWCKELGVDRASWGWCHWGENITFRCEEGKNINENDMHLGDIWGIGKDVQLEVCGSRIPCYKLAWRCGQNDQWLKPLADSGLVGAYLCVRRPGRIHPGDKAVLLSKSTDSMNVALISRVAFDTSLESRDTLDILANHKLLLGLNRWGAGRRLTQLDDRLSEGKNAWQGWREFRAQKITDEGGGVKSFYIEPIDRKALANFQPGQFLTVRLPNGKTRNWSISDWPKDKSQQHYRISIKRRTDASCWMWDECSLDTILEVRSPAGRFVLDRSQPIPPRQIYISAGIGITPILAMMKAHSLHHNFDTTPGLWVHVTQNSGSFPLREEWADITHPLIKRVIFFTKPLLNDVAGVDYDYSGRPSFEFFQNLIEEPYFFNPLGTADVEMQGKMSSIYICGNKSFEESVKVHLSSLEVPQALIHSESFSANKALDSMLERATVRFVRSQRVGKWKKDKSQTLLELAESLGLTPAFGCRAGSCGSCAAKLLCGSVTGGLQLDGTILLCSAQPATAEVEVDV